MKPNYEHTPADQGDNSPRTMLWVAVLAMLGIGGIACFLVPPVSKAHQQQKEKPVADSFFMKQATDSGLILYDGFKSWSKIKSDVDSAKKMKWEETH